MSYIYSQALAAEYLVACSSDTALCVPWKLNPTVNLFLSNDKMTDYSRLSRYGMTLGLLTATNGMALLTWYQEDFLAKTSVLPETVQALPVKNPHSGSKCSESFGMYNPNTSSWRTPPDLFGMDSTLSSADFPKSGTMQSGVCWGRTMSERTTTANAAGYLPTPTVSGNNNRKGVSKTSGDGLATWVRKQYYPTPQASDVKRTGSLHDQCRNMRSGNGGRLNPEFVEWLMCVPIGWTDLKDSATLKSRSVRGRRGTFCTKELGKNKEKTT